MKSSNHYVSITAAAGAQRSVRVAAFALLLGAALPLAAQTTRDPLVQHLRSTVLGICLSDQRTIRRDQYAGIPGNNVWAGIRK